MRHPGSGRPVNHERLRAVCGRKQDLATDGTRTKHGFLQPYLRSVFHPWLPYPDSHSARRTKYRAVRSTKGAKTTVESRPENDVRETIIPTHAQTCPKCQGT